MASIDELRQELLAHQADIAKQREEYKAIGAPDPYMAGHLEGLLNGFAFALRYLNTVSPEPVEPFDLLGPISAGGASVTDSGERYRVTDATASIGKVGSDLGAERFSFLPGGIRFWFADGQRRDVVNAIFVDAWMPLPVADAEPFAFSVLMDEGVPTKISEEFIGEGDRDDYDSVPKEELEAAIFAVTGRQRVIDSWDAVFGTDVPEAIAHLQDP